MKERLPLRTILIALGALVLFVVGLSVVVVNIARSRVQPEPTAPLALATMTKSSTATAVSISEILTPRAPGTQEPDTVVGVVRSYEPGGLIIVIVPTEGVADQIIVPDNIEVLREHVDDLSLPLVAPVEADNAGMSEVLKVHDCPTHARDRTTPCITGCRTNLNLSPGYPDTLSEPPAGVNESSGHVNGAVPTGQPRP